MSAHASHEALTLDSPVPHPTRKARVLKRLGVGEGEGELGADFASIVLPRHYKRGTGQWKANKPIELLELLMAPHPR